MNEPAHNTPPWTRLVLILACAGAVAAAVLVVGPKSQGSTTTTTRIITAEKGVVQSTVSGDGTLQPVTQQDANFDTSGTLEHLYVTSGQQVSKGQLLATLNPQQAQVGVQQADASLQAAEASLQAAQSTQATAESASSSSTASAEAAIASAADVNVEEAPRSPAPADASTGTTGATGPAGTTAPSGPAPDVTTTVTVTATPHATAGRGGSSLRSISTTAPRAVSDASSAAAGTGSSFSDTGANTPSAATLAANVASAQAQVSSAELDVQSADQTLADTRLYAPVSGIVASVADVQVGDTISAGGASSSSSDNSSDTGSSGSGSSGSGRSSLASLLGGGSSSSSNSGSDSSSSSSSAFVTIVDPSRMELVVPFTESDIGKLAVGQPATVTVNALSNVELAAHVTNVSLLASSTSSVTTYNVTLDLDQNNSQVKPGMSATAQVVVSQATGAVSVPTTAISRTAGQSTVTVQKNGKDVVTPVVTGVVGDSTTQILSGVNPGDQIVITTRLNLGSTGTTTGTGTGFGGLGRALTGGGGGLFGGGGGGGGFARALGGG